MNPENNFDAFYNNCISKLTYFEIWPGYYKRRYEEFKRIYKLFPAKKFDKILEIGCGIGFQSGLLSCISNQVVASDIDLGDMIKHSRGLNITRQFLKQGDLQNIEVVNASAEQLPFKDEEFDLIYCSYSFQYIPDKYKAMQELKRVLKKEGYFICILPTTAGRLQIIPPYYIDIFKKLKSLLLKKNPGNEISSKILKVDDKKAVKKKTKFLPPPDDEDNSFIKELFSYAPYSWKQLFKINGYQIIDEKYLMFSRLDKPDNTILERIRKRITAEGLILIVKK